MFWTLFPSSTIDKDHPTLLRATRKIWLVRTDYCWFFNCPDVLDLINRYNLAVILLAGYVGQRTLAVHMSMDGEAEMIVRGFDLSQSSYSSLAYVYSMYSTYIGFTWDVLFGILILLQRNS